MTGKHKKPVPSDIQASLNAYVRESFERLNKMVYELALIPSIPLKHYQVHVKCERANGVRLVQGKEDSNSAHEFIY